MNNIGNSRNNSELYLREISHNMYVEGREEGILELTCNIRQNPKQPHNRSKIKTTTVSSFPTSCFRFEIGLLPAKMASGCWTTCYVYSILLRNKARDTACNNNLEEQLLQRECSYSQKKCLPFTKKILSRDI